MARMANASEILSAQTEFLCEHAGAAAELHVRRHEHRSGSIKLMEREESSLDSVRVVYGLTKGISADGSGKVVAGLGASVDKSY